MAEVIKARDQYTKKYYLGNNRYSMDVSMESVHYQDEYGNWQEIDTTIVESPKANWDWEVTKGHWTLLIRDDTAVAIGKDGHWLGFRYGGFGYLDWASKDYEIYIYSESYDDANVNIHFQKSESPAAFTTATNDITDTDTRPRTTESVSWVEDAVGTGRQGGDKR